MCGHKGTYADDCIVDRITEQKCYIVATCDRELKRRIRKQPGVPILYIKQHQFTVERMPDADDYWTSAALSTANTGTPRTSTISCEHELNCSWTCACRLRDSVPKNN